MIEFYDMETYCMGTNVVQRIYGKKHKKVLQVAADELKRLEKMLSFYRKLSEVSLINQNAGHEYVNVSKETLNIIKEAKKYSELSDGVFDITSAPLIELWGIFTARQRVPLDEEISKAKTLINYKDISIDETSLSVKLRTEGQKIDLGGIAKGFAADRAAQIYKSKGVKSAFINIGGNVIVLGSKPEGDKWNIGIQNPLKPRGECIGAVAVADKTVVTSGDYVRYFIKDNKRYHHILDPMTGYPSNSGVVSVTVICESSIEADALSTAAFILGLKKGIKLIKSLNFVDAIFITEDKKVYATEGIKENFIFAGEKDGFSYAEGYDSKNVY